MSDYHWEYLHSCGRDVAANRSVDFAMQRPVHGIIGVAHRQGMGQDLACHWLLRDVVVSSSITRREHLD